MKKIAMALPAIIFSVMFVCPKVSFIAANPIPHPDKPTTELPTLIIRTPKNYSDYYADSTFQLDFIIIQPEGWDLYYKGFIPIIGQYSARVYLDGTWTLPQRSPRSDRVTDYAAVFKKLSDTEHVIQIIVEASAYYMGYFARDGETVTTGLTNNTYITQTVHFQLEPDSKTVLFQKDPQVVSRDPYPNPPTPVPIIISPQNTNYTTNNIAQFSLSLDFLINETASWIGYSLDSKARVTIDGNCTLSELSLGSHKITFFASGTFGNLGISNTTYFNIESAPEPLSFPSSVMASSVTVAAVVVGLGLLVYLIKRK